MWHIRHAKKITATIINMFYHHVLQISSSPRSKSRLAVTQQEIRNLWHTQITM